MFVIFRIWLLWIRVEEQFCCIILNCCDFFKKLYRTRSKMDTKEMYWKKLISLLIGGVYRKHVPSSFFEKVDVVSFVVSSFELETRSFFPLTECFHQAKSCFGFVLCSKRKEKDWEDFAPSLKLIWFHL